MTDQPMKPCRKFDTWFAKSGFGDTQNQKAIAEEAWQAAKADTAEVCPSEIPDNDKLLSIAMQAAHQAPIGHEHNLRTQMALAIDALRPYLRSPVPVSVSLMDCAMALQGNQRIKLGSDLQAIAKAVLNAAGVKYVD